MDNISMHPFQESIATLEQCAARYERLALEATDPLQKFQHRTRAQAYRDVQHALETADRCARCATMPR